MQQQPESTTWTRKTVGALILAGIAIGSSALYGRHGQDQWFGLEVAEESVCAEYDENDYSYPRWLKREIIEQQGGLYSAYTGLAFDRKRDAQIEHIVPLREPHESGMCARDGEAKERFANDIANLTLATRRMQQRRGAASDAADWEPPRNRCWFAQVTIQVRQAHGLTIDRAEADALEKILASCE